MSPLEPKSSYASASRPITADQPTRIIHGAHRTRDMSRPTCPQPRRPRRATRDRRTVKVSCSGEDEFDLVVIGCGPAGEKGASQAAYFGHRVAVVERRRRPGGAAIAVSGVPVKALRDTAVYLSGWSRRDTYGVGIGLAPDLVMDRLRARVRDVFATMTSAVAENLNRHGVELVRGDARLGPGPDRDRA